MIPCVDIRALFAAASPERAQADATFLLAAETIGFVQVCGFGRHVDVSETRRAALKRIFALSAEQKRRLWRQKFAPDHVNVYRGWFPLQEGHATRKEGIDLGPDVVPDFEAVNPTDPLCEPTPLPEEAALPGWRALAARQYTEMAGLGFVLMRALARGLTLPEDYFDCLFARGISTLRLIHYPLLEGCGTQRVVGAAHVDSGLMTLLVQDGVGGLQVRAGNASFLDVPVRQDAVTVNFGRLLALWSGGRIRATEHRVLGGTRSRCSFPFFHEPRVDALIEPLPGAAARFAPFQYGDFLWHATTRFVEFQGMERLRAARGNPAAAAAAVA